MRPRALPLLLLLAAAPAAPAAPAGDAAPERDPFLAALAGRSGPAAVAAPGFDPGAEALAWSARPRREIVDALAARILRGKAGESRTADPPPPAPPRLPADPGPGAVAVSDRLAAWVPADAAAVFFGSLREAEDAVGGLAGFLPRALPGLCGEPAEGRRDALRRAVDGLLLPTIWRSNPGVRTGTRQVALVVSDPDVRWAPEIALLCEVDDAGLVRFHRQSTISWEDRSPRRLRVEGLDVAADDGSVRSRFALEGGIALWSTTRALRERILAAGAGRAPSLLAPPAAAYGLARRTFPDAGGGALLVVPDGFLARNGAPGVRARRAAALRCEAARLLLDARSVAGAKVSSSDTMALACPSGGALAAVPGGCGSSCAVHGTAAWPAPLGDLPEAASPEGARVPADALAEGAVPVAARWDGEALDVLVPPGAAGERLLAALGTWAAGTVDPAAPSDRGPALEARFPGRDRPGAELLALTGLAAPDGAVPFPVVPPSLPPAPRPGGGVLRIVGAPGGLDRGDGGLRTRASWR